MLDAARRLMKHGYEIYATGGTSRYLTENGIENTRVLWPSETISASSSISGASTAGIPSALDLLHAHKIDLVVNIPKNLSSHELSNCYKIRRAAIDLNVPLITNSRLASAFIRAFTTITLDEIRIKSWAEYR
jgi:carbamoyl-phosphate synthase large subunit